jgi:hypothetical protein
MILTYHFHIWSFKDMQETINLQDKIYTKQKCEQRNVLTFCLRWYQYQPIKCIYGALFTTRSCHKELFTETKGWPVLFWLCHLIDPDCQCLHDMIVIHMCGRMNKEMLYVIEWWWSGFSTTPSTEPALEKTALQDQNTVS